MGPQFAHIGQTNDCISKCGEVFEFHMPSTVALVHGQPATSSLPLAGTPGKNKPSALAAPVKR